MIKECLFIEAPLPGFFGSTTFYACLPYCPAPIGFVWLRFPGLNCMEITYIFVLDEFRRKGVATMLLNELRNRKPGFSFLTALASNSSEPWLVKNGFEKTNNGWSLKG